MSEAKKNLRIKCEEFWTAVDATVQGNKLNPPKGGGEYYCSFDKKTKEYIIEVPVGNKYEYYIIEELSYRDSGLSYRFSIKEVDVDYVVEPGDSPCYGYHKEIDMEVMTKEDFEKMLNNMGGASSNMGMLNNIFNELSEESNTGHYGHEDDIQVVDLLESQGYAEGFYRGNIVKYVMRAGRKASSSEFSDLMKAMDYLEMEIARITKHKLNRNEQ